jgi:hypothetical protein
MGDFLDTAHRILASLEREVPVRQIPRPEDAQDDWLMAELTAESSSK